MARRDFASGINMLELAGQFSGFDGQMSPYVVCPAQPANTTGYLNKSLTAPGFILIMSQRTAASGCGIA